MVPKLILLAPGVERTTPAGAMLTVFARFRGILCTETQGLQN